MAKADISVRHRPQDGAFRLKVNGRPIDVRLSSLPTVDGEKLVMRVIDSHSPLQTLDRLGYDDETLARFERAPGPSRRPDPGDGTRRGPARRPCSTPRSPISGRDGPTS